jgi:hypothetical protein
VQEGDHNEGYDDFAKALKMLLVLDAQSWREKLEAETRLNLPMIDWKRRKILPSRNPR